MHAYHNNLHNFFQRFGYLIKEMCMLAGYHYMVLYSIKIIGIIVMIYADHFYQFIELIEKQFL